MKPQKLATPSFCPKVCTVLWYCKKIQTLSLLPADGWLFIYLFIFGQIAQGKHERFGRCFYTEQDRPQEMQKKKRKKQLVIYSYMEAVTPPQILGVHIPVICFFLDALDLPSLTVFSPWLFEWSGRSETRVWWECECLALRLSISVAVSELPRLVNFPRVKTRIWYLVYPSEKCLKARDSSWG